MSWFKEQIIFIQVVVVLIVISLLSITGVSGYLGIKAGLERRSTASSDGVVDGAMEDLVTPPLEVYEPNDFVVTSEPQLKFEGATVYGTSLALNDKLYPVSRTGSFSITANLKLGENRFKLKAWKRVGAIREKDFMVIFRPSSIIVQNEIIPDTPKNVVDQPGPTVYQIPKPEICENCGGSGIVPGDTVDGVVQSEICPVCGGSGTIDNR